MMHNLLSYPESTSGPHLAARIISDFVNPLFIPPVVLSVVGWLLEISTQQMIWMGGLSLFFYTALPLGYTLYLIKSGMIRSIDLPGRKNRNKLFIYSIFSSGVGSLLLFAYFYYTAPLLSVIAAVFFLNPLLGYIINLKWKISIHTASVGAMGEIFFILFCYMFQLYTSWAGILSLITLLLLLPSMIWARHHLAIHSLSELIGGACAGILLTLIELGIMIQFW